MTVIGVKTYADDWESGTGTPFRALQDGMMAMLDFAVSDENYSSLVKLGNGPGVSKVWCRANRRHKTGREVVVRAS
nr:hypothetical protein CFP56_24414 [Quercus suber]